MHMLTREEKINRQGEVCGASFLTSKGLKTLSTHQNGFFKILSLDACVLYKVAFPHRSLQISACTNVISTASSNDHLVHYKYIEQQSQSSSAQNF